MGLLPPLFHLYRGTEKVSQLAPTSSSSPSNRWLRPLERALTYMALRWAPIPKSYHSLRTPYLISNKPRTLPLSLADPTTVL